jgi:predicted transcriptional regulator
MKARKTLPPLTRAEAEIMQVLWNRGGATVHELVAAADRPVEYTTMLTLVRILEKKGYVGHVHRPGQRAHTFLPLVARESARRSHLRDFISRFFDGSPEELVVGLIAHEKLDTRTLMQLRQRIDERLARSRKRRGST